MGLRLTALQICILITDGKSQDDAEQPALRLKSLGIKVFAVGEQIRGVPIGIHIPLSYGLPLGLGTAITHHSYPLQGSRMPTARS